MQPTGICTSIKKKKKKKNLPGCLPARPFPVPPYLTRRPRCSSDRDPTASADLFTCQPPSDPTCIVLFLCLRLHPFRHFFSPLCRFPLPSIPLARLTNPSSATHRGRLLPRECRTYSGFSSLPSQVMIALIYTCLCLPLLYCLHFTSRNRVAPPACGRFFGRF